MKPKSHKVVVYASVLACLSYCICSMSMTFTSKALLSVYHFEFPLCLLLYQHLFTLFLVGGASSLGFIDLPPISLNLVRNWYPVNILFVLMLTSGSFSLKYLSVPMVTIFKNITTCLVAFGDFFFFSQRVTFGISLSVLLMFVSSLIAGFLDLYFTAVGYAWMSFNCTISAAYVLYMRFAMKKTQLDEWGMVFYNNLLAVPTLLPILLVSGELSALSEQTPSVSKVFLVLFIWSGISGLCLSVSSFWAIKTTSPTTYSIVGSLNKIPLTLLGFVFFGVTVTTFGGVSIAVGLFAAFIYSIEKQRSAISSKVLPTRG